MDQEHTAAHHVLDCRHHLCKDPFGFQVTEAPSAGDSGEQVPAAAVLHHQIQLPARLDHFIQTHNIRVTHFLHAAHLRGHMELLLLFQTHFVHDFDSNSLWRFKGKDKRENKNENWHHRVIKQRNEGKYQLSTVQITLVNLVVKYSKGKQQATFVQNLCKTD